MSQRIVWIDSWKGIAIILVVVGHIVEPVSKYIFWFHMPLFFFMSGYLYRNKYDYFTFFKKKLFHLLIPYLSFLVLLSSFRYGSYMLDMWQQRQNGLINKVLKFTFNLVYGGENLYGYLGIFWFITCLFFTQQLYNLLYTKFGSNNRLMIRIMFASYCLAMMNFWFMKGVSFPWNINVVVMALPFYWIGHIAASSSVNNAKAVTLSAVIIVVAVLVDKWTLLDLTFDMKSRNYGVIIFNFFIGLAGIFITQHLAKILQNEDYISKILSEIGKASMIIMYLHQLIQLSLNNYSVFQNDIIRVMLGLLIPYIIYKKIVNYSVMQKLFLGELGINTIVKNQDTLKV
ncbi:MAG: acyltransferase family protein [Nostoc sp.]|uniref:acyltransferase family protein n=1 Tax=Nostoc sp. TaxID=1180 RepID=UPI002FFABC3A